MAFDAAAIAGVAEYQASLMDAESRFQAAKSRLLSLIRTSMDQVTAATTEAVVSSGGIPSAYTTGYRATDASGNDNSTLMSPNRLPSRAGTGITTATHTASTTTMDPQKQKEMEMEKFASSLPLLQPVNPRHHKHSHPVASATSNRNRAASGKRRDDTPVTATESISHHTNAQAHSTSSTDPSSTHTVTSAKGRARRLAEGVAYGRAQTAGSESGYPHKDNATTNDHDNDYENHDETGRRKSKSSIDDDSFHNNPLGGPVGHGSHKNNGGGNKEERKPKDFDLRLGPAYTTDMEKLRAKQAVEWRAKREEAHTRLVMLSSTLTNNKQGTNPPNGSTNNPKESITTTTTMNSGSNHNGGKHSSRASTNNPTANSQQSRQSRSTTDPNDPTVSSPRTDFATAYPITSSVFSNFGVTDSSNLPSPPVLFGHGSNPHSSSSSASMTNPHEWNIPSLSGSPTTNNIIMSMQQTASDGTNGYPSMIPYDYSSQLQNPAYGSMFPPSGAQMGPMMMDPHTGQPMGFIHPETGILLPFVPSSSSSNPSSGFGMMPPYPSNGTLPGQGYAQTPAGTVSGAQILEHMNAVANTQRRVGTASGRLRSDPSMSTKYQSYDTVNDKKNNHANSDHSSAVSSSAFRTTGKSSGGGSNNNALRNTNVKPVIRKVSANRMNNKNGAPLAATAYVHSSSTLNDGNPNSAMYPAANSTIGTPYGQMDPSLMIMQPAHPYPPGILPTTFHNDQENNGDAERKRTHTGSSDSSDQTTMNTDNNNNNPNPNYPYYSNNHAYSLHPSSQYLNGVLPTSIPSHYPYPYSTLTSSSSLPSSSSHYSPHHSPSHQPPQQHSPIQQVFGTGSLLNISSQANAIVKYELSINRSNGNSKNSPLSPIERVDDDQRPQSPQSPEPSHPPTNAPKPYSRVLAPSDAIAAANNRAQAAVAASRNNEMLRTPVRRTSNDGTNDTNDGLRSAHRLSSSSSGVLDRSFPLASPTSIDSTLTPEHKDHHATTTDETKGNDRERIQEKEHNTSAHNQSTASTDISGLDLSSSDAQLLSPEDKRPTAKGTSTNETKENEDDSNAVPNTKTDSSVIDQSLSGDVDEHLRLMMMEGSTMDDTNIDRSTHNNGVNTDTVPSLTEVDALLHASSSLAPSTGKHTKEDNDTNTKVSLNESFDDSKLADEITNALAKEIVMEIDTKEYPESSSKMVEKISSPMNRTVPPSFELVPTVAAGIDSADNNDESAAYVRSNIVLSIPDHHHNDPLEDSTGSKEMMMYTNNYSPKHAHHHHPNDPGSNDHLELQAQAVEALMWQGPSSTEKEPNDGTHAFIMNGTESTNHPTDGLTLHFDESKLSNLPLTNSKHSVMIGARGASPINA